jgi:hypothetical protein
VILKSKDARRIKDKMTKSVCISCILFTLEGKKSSENHYIQIFLIWLSELAKSANLQSGDMIHIDVDEETLKHLQINGVFTNLLSCIRAKTEIRILPKPKTVLEGMMWRYRLFDYDQDVFFYCDIDCLLVNPIHNLIDTLDTNTIYLHKEGNLHSHEWGAAFSAEELQKIPSYCMGFSSGKFIISDKSIYHGLLTTIYNLYISQTDVDFYTLDQPFFNKAIYQLTDSTVRFNTNILEIPIVATNYRGYSKEKTVLLDFMGEPGNGIVHLEKLVNHLCMCYVGILK